MFEAPISQGRYFNVAGPCNPVEHYMLPALMRLDEIKRLIETRQFFVIHAARQSGKTTLLNDLAGLLDASGRYYALYCSLESVQGIEDAEKGIPAVVGNIRSMLPYSSLRAIPPDEVPDGGLFSNRLRVFFNNLCARLDKPLVVLFDEADCLSGPTLISFLRQLRDGYVNRGRAPFIHALALVGMRDIRDFKAQVRPDSQTLGSASPFNIVTKSLTLRNFTRDEIAALYAQHTADTGQVFEPEAIDGADHWTAGQPWLVNALAREVVEELLDRDFGKPVTRALIDEAAERIMRRRDTHLDSLLERLKEPRVQRIVEPMLTGEEGDIDRLSDDYLYVRDLGLIRTDRGVISPANPIYATVMVRTLNYNSQEDLPPSLINRWMTDEAVDVDALLRSFQQFWRENSGSWAERYAYREAAPHLILMAYLQRVLNGGALIEREMSAGSKRIDLGIRYKDKIYPIELKVNYGPKARAEGLEQLAAYMDTLGASRGWLVIFDRDPKKTWDEKITWVEEQVGERKIAVIGC